MAATIVVSAGEGAATAGRTSLPGQPPVAVVHVPPVDAPVTDPFRPPAGPYAPGNRGIEYATRPGTPVRASAAGTVAFVGPVGGALHVTVLHDDGIRTSYSFLATVGVVRGQQVGQGAVVGTAGERLHFGARSGDDYFDPASLFAGATAEVVLLPFEVPPGSTPDAEARALVQLSFDGGSGLSLPGPASTLDWLRARADAGALHARRLSPLGRGLELAGALADGLFFAGPCASGAVPTRPVAGRSRAAITVAGLGSSGTSGSIDDLRVGDLGYDPDRVVRFSYAGGRTPGTGGAFDGLDARDYASADTQGDVRMAAVRLADLVEDVAAAEPGLVDIFAHSLGGLVTRLALVELELRGFDLSRLGVVATLGTPHEGADLATAVAVAETRVLPRVALAGAEHVLGTGLDPAAPVVGQLAEHSEVVAGLMAAGVPEGVHLLSVAARGDLVVPAPRTRARGAAEVTVPVSGLDAHGDLVGSDAATDELARALAGQPPGCETWDDVLADVVAGHAISAVEGQLVGVAASAGW